ncbi:MAG: hypothetical protein P1T08_17600 [Acidimicrobiia bacterium]|nr:hypothetical protein [Acidimicrobiia bacterium]
MGNLRLFKRGATVTSRPEPRARVELRLSGGSDGAIPLNELAQVANHAQELVRKLARAIADKSGPGRPPAVLDQMSALVAVGIHQGSAVLDIEAPSWSGEFDLAEDVGFDAGIQALEMVADAMAAVAGSQPLPDKFNESSRADLAQLLEATSSYERLEWNLSHHGKEVRASVSPMAISVPALHQPTKRPPGRGTVEGELYALNARTGSYQLEDAALYTIRCHVEPGSILAAELDRLVRRTVAVTGIVDWDKAGRATDVRVEAINARPHEATNDFWDFRLEKALSDVHEITGIEDLALAEITPEEADAFRTAMGFE